MNIPKADFLSGVSAIARSVYEFHQRFDIPAVEPDKPVETLDALRQRLALLAEESGEYARALNRGDIDDAVKEAVDVAYIALGTILRLGEPGRAACIEVARKNDAKTPSSHSKRSLTGKVLQT